MPGYEAMYRSADGAVEMLSVRLSADPMGQPAHEAVVALRSELESVDGDGLQADVTGTVAITADYLEAVIMGTNRTTVITVLLVVVILLLIYRAPVAALVPLLTIGASFVAARAALALLAMAGWQIPPCWTPSSSWPSSASARTTPSSCSPATAKSWAGGPATWRPS